MSLIKKINDPNGKQYDDVSIGALVLDTEPIEGSFNPVTSDGVKNAIDDSVDAAKAEMQEKIDEVTLDPSAVALGNVHLLDEVTEFPADGCILIDSETNGPGEMSKDKLLELTAQNALASVKSLSTTITDFRNGDVMLVDGPSTPAKMKSDTLLHLAVQKVPLSVVNLFNKNTVDDGFYIDISTGNALPLSDWSVSEFIYVKGFSTLELMLNVYNHQTIYAFYDIDGNFINGAAAISKYIDHYVDIQVSVPANAAYIRVSMLTADKDTYMLVDEANYSQGMDYVDYGVYCFNNGKILDSSLNENKVKKETITLLRVGSGRDYTTFGAAMAVVSANPSLKYRIEIDEGTYDVFDGESIDSSYIGFNVSNVEIVGIGNKNNIVLYGYLSSDDYSSTIRDKVSIFNIKGNFKAKNLTISAKNIRYTIHDDYEDVSGCVVDYEDVVFVGDSMTHNNIYGCGLWNGTKYKFTRCKFLATNGTYCYGFHKIDDPSKAITPSDIIFNECVFETTNSYWCTFNSNHDKYNDNLTFNGCSFVGSIYPTGANCSVNINGKGNSDLFVRDGTTNKNCKVCFGDTTMQLFNSSGNTIPKGSVVKRNGWNGVALCGNSDIFLGVTIEDIANGSFGTIQTKGVLPNDILTCYTGNSISNNNGVLEIGTSNIVGRCVYDNFIKIM